MDPEERSSPQPQSEDSSADSVPRGGESSGTASSGEVAGSFTPPVAGADFLAALVQASWPDGAWPPVDFREVFFCLGMMQVNWGGMRKREKKIERKPSF